LPSRVIVSRQSVPKIRNQKIAIAREREAIRQCPAKVTVGLAAGGLKMPGTLLRHDALRSIRADLHHPAAGVSRPQCSVRLGQNAFRPLQFLADISDPGFVEMEIADWVSQVISDPFYVAYNATQIVCYSSSARTAVSKRKMNCCGTPGRHAVEKNRILCTIALISFLPCSSQLTTRGVSGVITDRRGKLSTGGGPSRKHAKPHNPVLYHFERQPLSLSMGSMLISISR
jgi:hypothetical protein